MPPCRRSLAPPSFTFLHFFIAMPSFDPAFNYPNRTNGQQGAHGKGQYTHHQNSPIDLHRLSRTIAKHIRALCSRFDARCVSAQ